MTRPDQERRIQNPLEGIHVPDGVTFDEKAQRRLTQARRAGVDDNTLNGLLFALGETVRRPDGEPVVVTTREQSFYFDVLKRAVRGSTRGEYSTQVFPDPRKVR